MKSEIDEYFVGFYYPVKSDSPNWVWKERIFDHAVKGVWSGNKGLYFASIQYFNQGYGGLSGHLETPDGKTITHSGYKNIIEEREWLEYAADVYDEYGTNPNQSHMHETHRRPYYG